MHKKILLLGLLILVAAGAYFFLRGNDGGAQQQATGQHGVSVSVVTLKLQNVDFTETLPGRTSAYKVAEIRPQVSGIIVERSFTEGDTVEAGQQLYQIDPAPYQAAYESARAELLRAEANAKSVQSRSKRYAQLVEVDAVSKQEYDDIKAELAQAQADIAVAKAQVTQAKINLDYTKVYSPISGGIGKSAVTEGALVTANQAAVLTKVTQLDPIYVDMTQSSTEMMQLRNQMGEMTQAPTVTLRVENGMEYGQVGQLQFSDITVEESTGSVQLRALFPNPDRVLLPGLFVRAQVNMGTQAVLLIPQQAAIRDADGNLSAWVVGNDNTVNPRPISVLRAYEGQWVVQSGLEAGEKVVTEGFQKITPGANVSPVPQAQAEEQEQEKVLEAAEKVEEGEAPAPAMAAPAAPDAEGDEAEAQDAMPADESADETEE